MNPSLLALFAYAWWGLVPIYWKYLAKFPAAELILYRVLLSFIFLVVLVYITKKTKLFYSLATQKKTILTLTASSLLIGFNWFLYIWAVNNNHVVDASLGYFINPLLNMALGFLVFGDKLRRYQKVAGILAFLGTFVLIYNTQTVPWIALLLGISFSLYGLLRKILQAETLTATLWETLVLALPCLAALIWMHKTNQTYTPHAQGSEIMLLLFCGLITTMPILAFAEAAKKLTLTRMGFFQFLSPSLQFLLGIFLFHEPFDRARFFAFLLIWMGLLLFIIDLLRRPTTPKRHS